MYELNDKDLGTIIVSPNPRAKRIIARRKSDHFLITTPQAFNLSQVKRVIEEIKPQLLKMKVPLSMNFDEHTTFNTLTFSLKIEISERLRNSIQMNLENGLLTLRVAQNSKLDDEATQRAIKEMIMRALKHEAQRILIPKTLSFAQKLNLEVRDVKISKSVSRWGSCSTNKSINLSLFLMLLPEKYIDYVILHELAHTKEMNHGPKFWKLLDSFCGEDSKALSKSVRKYKSFEKEILMRND